MLFPIKFVKSWQGLQAFLLLVSLCLSACTNDNNQYTTESDVGKASIGEIKQTKYLFNSDSVTVDISFRATTAEANKAAIDVLILLDRTMSMEKFINTTADASEKIVSDIQSIAPNTRFAVAAVSDYSPLFTPDTDKRTWLLLTDFTYKGAEVANATKSISLTNGGDTPEAYVRGLYEASEMTWRQDAKKILIFFGDATAHQIDPGRDETLGTSDDLNMDAVIANLKAKDISVIGIHTRNDSEVVNEFSRISSGTSGKSIPLSSASESAYVIQNSINEALPDPPNFQTNSEYSRWINTSNSGKAVQSKIDYHVQITPPLATRAGVYIIPLNLVSTTNNGQLIDNFLGKPFEVKVITGWYNHPLTLWLPLLMLLTYLILSTFWMIKGGYSKTVHVTAKKSYDLDSYGLQHLMLDTLVIMSLVSSVLAIYLHLTEQVLSQLLNSFHLI